MELMNKQKTIAMLEEMKVKDPFDRYMKQNIGLDWAIDAIQTAPIIQLCDDTISRQQAIDALESIGSLDTEADRQYARTVFENLPSAQTEIIRCKDCRHNGSFDTDCPIKWNGKDFCSFAERRTDEQ